MGFMVIPDIKKNTPCVLVIVDIASDFTDACDSNIDAAKATTASRTFSISEVKFVALLSMHPQTTVFAREPPVPALVVAMGGLLLASPDEAPLSDPASTIAATRRPSGVVSPGGPIFHSEPWGAALGNLPVGSSDRTLLYRKYNSDAVDLPRPSAGRLERVRILDLMNMQLLAERDVKIGYLPDHAVIFSCSHDVIIHCVVHDPVPKPVPSNPHPQRLRYYRFEKMMKSSPHHRLRGDPRPTNVIGAVTPANRPRLGLVVPETVPEQIPLRRPLAIGDYLPFDDAPLQVRRAKTHPGQLASQPPRPNRDAPARGLM